MKTNLYIVTLLMQVRVRVGAPDVDAAARVAQQGLGTEVSREHNPEVITVDEETE